MITLIAYLTKPSYIYLDKLTIANIVKLQKFAAGPNYALTVAADILLAGLITIILCIISYKKSSSNARS